MSDKDWEESPKIQKIKAESEARGELRVARRMFIKIVGTRFPTLIELAKNKPQRSTAQRLLNTWL
jgi:hypothetical protein